MKRLGWSLWGHTDRVLCLGHPPSRNNGRVQVSQANKVESVKRPKIVRVDEARAHACGGDQERESIAPTRRAPPFRSVFRRYGSSLPPPRETPRVASRYQEARPRLAG